MSAARHPYKAELGSAVEAGALQRAAARALAVYAASDLDEDTVLVECRLRTDGAETVILRVRAYPPQRPAADIRREEELAVVFAAEDRHPALLALRTEFPETPHQTSMPASLPRYPCVDERPWAEATPSWTPYAYVERVKWWLNAAANGELTGDEQHLDPLFFPTGLDLIVPGRLLEQHDDDRTYVLTRPDNIPDEDVKCLHLVDITGAGEPSGKRFKALLVAFPPREATVMRALPVNMAELLVVLDRHGFDLAGRLGAWVTEACGNVDDLRSKAAILVNMPVSRDGGASIARHDLRAFALTASLGELGTALGVLHPVPSAPGRWGRVLGTPQPDAALLVSMRLLAMSVQLEFDRAVARECSGLCDSETPEVLLAGAGAIGSHLATTLTREGRHTWTIMDDDWLRPHNLARHALGRRYVGMPKAKALAQELSELSGAETHAIVADVLNLGGAEGRFREAAARATCVLDASASVAVARRLSDWDLGPARRISAFFNPMGNAGVLLAEDAARAVRLDTVETQYYRLLLREPSLAGHLAVPSAGYRYAGACRAVSARIPETRIAALSALVAQGFSNALASSATVVRVWTLAADGSVTTVATTPAPATRHAAGGWTVLLDGALVSEIADRRRLALPRETGGVLVGVVDTQRRTIAVVDALPPPPDSEGSVIGFTRGVLGLDTRLREIADRTGGMVRYVGEWHTHPRRHRSLPSATDVEQLMLLRRELRHEGLPPTMLIAGSDGIRVMQMADLTAEGVEYYQA